MNNSLLYISINDIIYFKEEKVDKTITKSVAFSQKDIERALASDLMSRREAERKAQRKKAMEPKTENIGKCSCGGTIIVLTEHHSEYNPMSGPGSRNQFRTKTQTSCYCNKCGLVYNAEIVRKNQEKAST